MLPGALSLMILPTVAIAVDHQSHPHFRESSHPNRTQMVTYATNLATSVACKKIPQFTNAEFLQASTLRI
jgi:hypothetical protein